MKYINGLDSEHADETCPKNEKILWTCLNGFPKINVVTLYTSKDFCLRMYTETGDIFDLPFSGYVMKGKEATDGSTNALAELAEDLGNIDEGPSPESICKAQRIIAELAKVESLYDKMNAKASNGHIVEAEELAHELHLAKGSLFANCRAIAEEGAPKCG